MNTPSYIGRTDPQRFRHETGGISICSLGQVGFLLQHRGVTIAIDPYLSYSVDRLSGFPQDFWVRSFAPPFAPERLSLLGLVLCTHDHLDHTDPESLLGIASASTHCRFAAPKLSADMMIKSGLAVQRVEVMNAGVKFAFQHVLIEPVAVAHETDETDRDGYHRYLGYLIHWDGMTLFHAGDTVATPELVRTLTRYSIDVIFLPINGRSEERHQLDIVGNLNAAEAVALAEDLQVDLVIPTHYDLYRKNGASLSEFANAWEQISFAKRPGFKSFLPGERILYKKSDRKREVAVIIGAGKTGRGFLTRLLTDSPYEVVFIEKSQELVQRLNEDGNYAIHFFGGKRPPFYVQDILAVEAGSDEAIEWMGRAKIIFTAVGESNIPGLEKDLVRTLEYRRSQQSPKLYLLVCENGATPALPLKKGLASYSAEVEIAEAAIFCSTIELPGTRLDIQSEAYDELPYDVNSFADFPAFTGMRPESEFPVLLLRKIYTYNCFSACIAYLGAYKKYQWYADAANDAEISTLLEQIAEPLNQAIALKFKIEIEEQRRFAQAALRKFKDSNIRDDILRNARNVVRKLAPNDRIIEPARLIEESGGSIQALALTIGAALLYHGADEEQLQKQLEEKTVAQILQQVSGLSPNSPLSLAAAKYYHLLKKQRNEGIFTVSHNLIGQ